MGEEFRRLSEPTSRAASQSAEGGYCGKQHKRGMGRSGVKSDLKIWECESEKTSIGEEIEAAYPFKLRPSE